MTRADEIDRYLLLLITEPNQHNEESLRRRLLADAMVHIETAIGYWLGKLQADGMIVRGDAAIVATPLGLARLEYLGYALG